MINNIGGYNPFAAAAGGAEHVRKILKQEEGKRSSKILKAIKQFHLAHQKVKEEIANALSQEIGENISPENPIVKESVFGLAQDRVYTSGPDGETILAPDLKMPLQHCESESKEAKETIANKLSQGSQGKVPAEDETVARIRDDIAIRSAQDDNLLFS